MSKMIRFVGLDVHKRVVEACIVDAQGKVVLRERFALDRRTLELFAKKFLRPTDRAALEATTNCWIVTELLQPYVAEVVVSNPMATKAIAQAKVKTDKVDAYVLAQLLRCDFLPHVWQPDIATQRLRQLASRRSALVGERTAAKNRIHSVLAMRLIAPSVSELFGVEGREWLRTASLDEQARRLVDSDLRLLDFFQKELGLMEEELVRCGYANQSVRLLMTLPCVNVTTAEAMMAAWGDPKRFPDAAHAASYLGLVPSTKQSATHCYHGPITKQGNSLARWMLIEAAQRLDRHPGPLGCFFRRLLRKKNRNVAVVAGARKLATIGWRMVVTGEPYRYAAPESTHAKLGHLRVRATGVRRPSGVPKGAKAVAKLPGGGHTVRSLAEVCQLENLPQPKSLAPGERRMVKQCGCEGFVTQISRQHVVPLRSRKGKDFATTTVKQR
jgi:transposase